MSFSQEQLMKLLSNDSFQLSEPNTPQLQTLEDETQQLQRQLLELIQYNQQYNTQLHQINDQIIKQDLIQTNLLQSKQRLNNQLQEYQKKNQKLQQECEQKDQEEYELKQQMQITRPKKRLFTQQSVGKVINFNLPYNNNIKKNSVNLLIKK